MLSKKRIGEIAEEIVQEAVRGKSDEEISRWEQDVVDATVFPTIQEIENSVDECMSDIISKAFNKVMENRVGRKWWGD